MEPRLNINEFQKILHVVFYLLKVTFWQCQTKNMPKFLLMDHPSKSITYSMKEKCVKSDRIYLHIYFMTSQRMFPLVSLACLAQRNLHKTNISYLWVQVPHIALLYISLINPICAFVFFLTALRYLVLAFVCVRVVEFLKIAIITSVFLILLRLQLLPRLNE